MTESSYPAAPSPATTSLEPRILWPPPVSPGGRSWARDPQLPEIREPATAYAVEREPAEGWSWAAELEDVEYSIRLPEPPEWIRCPRCDTRFSAAGPTGYAGEDPICDLCLLGGSHELGMVVALIAVVRAFGAVAPTDDEDYQGALSELGAFARIYERFATRFGPARVFRLPGFQPPG